MVRQFDIIIPTWNNPEYLNPCVMSILKTGVLNSLARLIIVNNGKQDMSAFLTQPNVIVLEPGKNLGWEGGLRMGLDASDAPFVVFQNDDTFLPGVSARFYQRLLSNFANDNVAAVGPSTTVAAGRHSVYSPAVPNVPTEVSYLIFFCVMVRRAHLDEVGGIDTTLPGGDDLDLSMRLRQAGKHILVDPGAFIIHHGFKTGERVKGTPDYKGGWNSPEMTERTNQSLIRKHGFRPFIKTLTGLSYVNDPRTFDDKEGEIVRKFIGEEKEIVELGCGGQKTVANAIGVDRVPIGEPIPHVNATSVANVVANVEDELPFEEKSKDVVIARHILEHCIDAVKTLKNWTRILKPGGKLLVAVPDERVSRGIPLNPEHVHAFTPQSLRSLAEACGLQEIQSASCENGVSFVGAFQRVN